MMLSVELLVSCCVAGRTPSASICEDTSGRLENVTAEVLNGSITIACYDPGKDVLHKVLNFGGLPDTTLKEARQRATKWLRSTDKGAAGLPNGFVVVVRSDDPHLKFLG
jgi:hypothetical protein